MRPGGYEQVRGFLQFTDRFPDEESCQEYLFRRRWPDGYACPRCGGMIYSHISTRNLYQCRYCRYQVSLTAGTAMEKTRTPLRIWFWMMFLIAHQKTGVSILGASRMLDISYKRAWLIARRIRGAMALRDSNYRLSGVVELDDTYFGGKNKPGKRGRGASGKTPVLVAVSVKGDKPGYASMRVLPNLTVPQIQKAVEDMVEPGSTILTDGLLAYTLALTGYEHRVKVISDPKTASKKLPWVHILIANVKGAIRGVHHGVSPPRLQDYLSEACWRFSRRWKDGELFDRLLCACVGA
ncbi:MAG: IS1595 family transposase [Actinobacteria bacterium]|nr:IS1595 family transposase [Actinomycetota bacterium]MBU1950051.1 IS1595 family transposase [Candidatus Eisenbacteria bacterium]